MSLQSVKCEIEPYRLAVSHFSCIASCGRLRFWLEKISIRINLKNVDSEKPTKTEQIDRKYTPKCRAIGKLHLNLRLEIPNDRQFGNHFQAEQNANGETGDSTENQILEDVATRKRMRNNMNSGGSEMYVCSHRIVGAIFRNQLQCFTFVLISRSNQKVTAHDPVSIYPSRFFTCTVVLERLDHHGPDFGGLKVHIQHAAARGNAGSVKKNMKKPNGKALNKTNKGNGVVKCRRRNCTESFESDDALMYHVTSYHRKGVKNAFSCHLCKKTFPTNKRKLRVHINAVHFGLKTAKCPYPMCSKSFATKSGLQSHTSRVHTKTFPFKCSKCTRKFYCKSDLGKHFAYKHGCVQAPILFEKHASNTYEYASHSPHSL